MLIFAFAFEDLANPAYELLPGEVSSAAAGSASCLAFGSKPLDVPSFWLAIAICFTAAIPRFPRDLAGEVCARSQAWFLSQGCCLSCRIIMWCHVLHYIVLTASLIGYRHARPYYLSREARLGTGRQRRIGGGQASLRAEGD